jgi:hypothetical protein
MLSAFCKFYNANLLPQSVKTSTSVTTSTSIVTSTSTVLATATKTTAVCRPAASAERSIDENLESQTEKESKIGARDERTVLETQIEDRDAGSVQERAYEKRIGRVMRTVIGT